MEGVCPVCSLKNALSIDAGLLAVTVKAAEPAANPAQRVGYLDGACAENPELHLEVESLLQVHEQAREFPCNILPMPSSERNMEEPGACIDRYKLIEQIGKGGFGVVWVASQEEPVRRRVALKIIKMGMDTKEVVARFETERQALAMMDHPHIAKILDGGTTSTGRPYFVMELVSGIPINCFCDKERLPIDKRINLFIQACRAVQHAHEKGIIHRDLKPSNVLVAMLDVKPVAKVIDFGIAKALGQKLTANTFVTNLSSMMGTPAYMSPEQAGLFCADIDTRSDIYSLGILLFELLTGRTPFDPRKLSQMGYGAILQHFQDEDHIKPSTRIVKMNPEDLNRVSLNRQCEARKLNGLLRGGLDAVVMKALEKNRARRYETVHAFIEDLTHYLRNEPVMAVAPSLRYKTRKFVSRHKTPIGVCGIIIALLVAGIGTSSWQLVRAR